MREVVIFGAGGHAHVIADIVRASGDQVVAFLDDEPTAADCSGAVCDYAQYADCEFVIGIGNAEARERISQLPLRWYTAIHPSAIISPSAQIGEGTVIMPNAVVNAGARIGRHCIINTCSAVEHGDSLDDFVHVSVGTRLGGLVHIGKASWIGIGATVNNCVRVCAGCLIGAGAVVVEDIHERGIYVGVPARRQEQ